MSHIEKDRGGKLFCTIYDTNLQLTSLCVVSGEIDHGRVVRRCLNIAMHAYKQGPPSSLWAGLACGGCVSGNSLLVAFIDSESVAVAILWR